jgi:hypothetical protein
MTVASKYDIFLSKAYYLKNCLITNEQSSLIIVMRVSDSLLDTLELIAITHKNEY